MPTLDWLNRDEASCIAERVPTRLLRPHPAGASFELNDGRLFVAEYKGEHLRGVPKEIEKGQVGRVWAEHSAGRCVFAMLFKLENGLNVAQQIDAALR